VEALLKAKSYDLGAKAKRRDDPAAWTEAKIHERAGSLVSQKGPAGNFDD